MRIAWKELWHSERVAIAVLLGALFVAVCVSHGIRVATALALAVGQAMGLVFLMRSAVAALARRTRYFDRRTVLVSLYVFGYAAAGDALGLSFVCVGTALGLAAATLIGVTSWRWASRTRADCLQNANAPH